MAMLAGYCLPPGRTFIDLWYKLCPLELCDMVASPERPRDSGEKRKKEVTTDYKKIIYPNLGHNLFAIGRQCGLVGKMGASKLYRPGLKLQPHKFANKWELWQICNVSEALFLICEIGQDHLLHRILCYRRSQDDPVKTLSQIISCLCSKASEGLPSLLKLHPKAS